MVFLIQNTQNRDGKAMQLKLDELLRSGRSRNSFIDIEDLSDEDLKAISDQFQSLSVETKSDVFKKLHTKIQSAHKSRTSN